MSHPKQFIYVSDTHKLHAHTSVCFFLGMQWMNEENHPLNLLVSMESGDFQLNLVGSFELDGGIVSLEGIC